MTSKSSWFDFGLIRQRMKRLTWLTALFSTVLFFVYPVYSVLNAQNLALRIQQERDYGTLETLVRQEEIAASRIADMFSRYNEATLVIALLSALLAATVAFHYLHVKQQTDFYHSQPMGREKLFITAFLAGVIVFVLPYVIAIGLAALVYSIFGLGGLFSAGDVLAGMGLVVLFYLLVYLTATTAMLLCGNTAVGLLGTGVFFAFLPACYGLITGYMSLFLDTFYYKHGSAVLRNISFIYDFFSENGFSALRVLAYVVLAAVLFLIDLLLYKKRRSEAAGKAIAFKKAKPIIKYAIFIPVVAAFALMFWEIGYERLSWMLFGLLCGGFLCHAIIEIIYEFDFKAIRSHIKPAVAFLLVTALLISIPVFDLAGYDRRLPPEKNVESVSLYPYSLDNIYTMRPYEYRGGWQMEQLTLSDPENIEAVRTLARMGAESQEKVLQLAEETRSVAVGFHRDGGMDMYRCYQINAQRLTEILKKMYDTEEFKQRLYNLTRIRSEVPEAEPYQVEWENFRTSEHGTIYAPERACALADALCRDLMKMSAETISQETILMRITILLNMPDGSVYDVSAPVYESSLETMALLAHYGIDARKTITAEEITSVTLRLEKAWTEEIRESAVADYEAATVEEWGLKTVEIRDKEQIRQLLAAGVPNRSAGESLFFKDYYQNIYMEVRSDSVSNGYYESWVLLKEKIPDFVLQEFPELAASSGR